jgi:predicted nucleic acid-binding protein
VTLKRTFLDTAVLARIEDESPREEIARQRTAAEALLSRRDRELVTSALVMGQLYSAITLPNKTDRRLVARGRAAVEDAKRLATIALRREHISYALDLMRRRQIALWDAVNWATAIVEGCDEYASFDAPGKPHTVDGVVWLDPLHPPPADVDAD